MFVPCWRVVFLSGHVWVFCLICCSLSKFCLPGADCRPHLLLLLLGGRGGGPLNCKAPPRQRPEPKGQNERACSSSPGGQSSGPCITLETLKALTCHEGREPPAEWGLLSVLQRVPRVPLGGSWGCVLTAWSFRLTRSRPIPLRLGWLAGSGRLGEDALRGLPE